MSVLHHWTKAARKCLLGSCSCIIVSVQDLGSLKQVPNHGWSDMAGKQQSGLDAWQLDKGPLPS